MTLTYAQSVQVTKPCTCKAHTQHRVFRFKFDNPSVTKADIAAALHMTETNVKKTLQRLRKAELSRRCPECFKDQVFEGVCHGCGREIFMGELPLTVDFESQSPTNSLHAGNQLGSSVNYQSLGIKGIYEDPTDPHRNDGVLLKQQMDMMLEDSLIKGVKSDVMQYLKQYYPSEAITDYAGRCCVWEVAMFRAQNPMLARSKGVRKQRVANVIKRLELVFPEFRRPPTLEGGQGDKLPPLMLEGDKGT